MLSSSLDAFRAEIRALDAVLDSAPARTLRDDDARERFRLLFRVWASSLAPSIKGHVNSRREFLKLAAELEVIAQLASKRTLKSEYRKRLRRAMQLLDSLVIYLPMDTNPSRPTATSRDGLFLPEIPDVPLSMVPNSVLGWRGRIGRFLQDHPFDKSVFIMIRYRQRNAKVLLAIKTALAKNGLFGVLASDHSLTDDLYNPIACLLCCSRGIAIFDRPESGQVFNPNVAYELGMFHLLGRECVILKHDTLRSLQSDILMKLYRPYSSHADMEALVATWLQALSSTI